ncbi:MAG: hypothetical protein JWM65_255 [Sphingomonas bacterium]|nr:hypothetical protein [Sphingomonas bacterium]
MGINLDMLSGSHYNIPDSAGTNIVPTHVIFRQIDYDIAKGHFRFSRRDLRVSLAKLQSKFTSPLDMMNYIANGGKLSSGQDDKPPLEKGELDFSIQVPSYVIVSIKPGFNWTFDPGKKGATLGSDTYLDYYEKLLHYDHVNNRLSAGGFKGCRHVVFSARPLPANPAGGDTEQPINFNLVDARDTPITVDPDIRYPGNTGLTEGDPEP